MPVGVLLDGIPRMERCGWRGRKERQVGWVSPPISALELQEWSAFEMVNGPILIHDRIETSIAIAAMTSAAPYTDKNRPNKLSDFIPVWDHVLASKPKQSADDIMEAIKSMAIKKYDQEEGRDVFYGDSGDVHP